MKSHVILLVAFGHLISLAPSHASDPSWWAARGVTNGASQSNVSPAAIGQAKHMAAMALAELQPKLAPADFAALQADVASVVNLTVPSPATSDFYEEQRSVLLCGQLKALAKPFYDRLRTLDGAWLNLKMHLSGVRVVEPSSNTHSPYPWTESAGDDSNSAVATVGQLKAVFSLPLESWISPDALNPALPWGAVDMDGDGFSDVTEIAMGTSPALADTDGDGHPDGEDAFPLDSTRWTLPGGPAGDVTGPTIILIEPVGAVPVP
jgi:hypothetical protein